MSIAKKEFGVTKKGEKTYLYTLTNEKGMEMTVTDFGAILVNLILPKDKGGKDVVLGYDNLADYEENGCFFGATIGRCGNRIGKARFELDKVVYQLDANENGNNLHTSFTKGFHKKVWSAKPDESANAVCFTYESPDGENGFPGALKTSVTYTLLEDGVQLTYQGISTKKTVFNPTNHSYFNLSGHESGSICDEKIQILADAYMEILPGAIPTGQLPPVEGTPMDLRQPKRIGEEIDADFEQLKLVQGYDHNWALSKKSGEMAKVARVEDEKAGLAMEVYTDLPGVQFYAGNCITPHNGKGGVFYDRRCGLCLETQYYPDAVNQEGFEKPFIEAGVPRKTTTIYRFMKL